jgi:glycogen phosphorylase
MTETTTKKPLRSQSGIPRIGGSRIGTTAADLKQSFLEALLCSLGRVPAAATPNDAYVALALAVRDRVLARGVRTAERYVEGAVRVVSYLSAEFLPGPHL